MAASSLRTMLRVATAADAAVVHAATLRRGLSAGLDRARAIDAARVASELAVAIVAGPEGGEIVLDVDLEEQRFWIVAQARAGLEALEQKLRAGAQSGTWPISDRTRGAGPDARSSALERCLGEVRFEPRVGGGSTVSCVLGPVGPASAGARVHEREETT